MLQVKYPSPKDYDCEEDFQEAWEKFVMKREAEQDAKREAFEVKEG